MMNHPNRNWKRRWAVDLAARAATHTDGWAVQFSDADDASGEFVGHLIAHPNITGIDIKALSRAIFRVREKINAFAG